MGKKKITKQSLIPIWEKKNLEEYYSQMAADGYFVSDKSMLYEEFIEGPGEQRRYEVLVHKNPSGEEIEVLRQSGWEKRFFLDDCLVLCTNQEDIPLPFEDDIEDWSNYLQKIETDGRVSGFGFSAFVMLIVLSFGRNIDLLGGFFIWISGYILFWALKCFMKYDRAKRVRQEVFWGKKDSRDWQGVKRQNQLYWVLFFIFIIAQIIYYI